MALEVKRVPWQGLGTTVLHDSTPEEMLESSGLDWTVSKRPPTVPFATTEELSAGRFIPVNDYFFLVRDSDNAVFGPAGKDYVPTQNRTAFDFFKKFSVAGKMRMETAGSLQGGRQVWALAKLPQGFELAGGDEVHGYLLFASPHIWGKALTIKFTTICVVCQNTFNMAMKDSTYGKGFRMPHIRAFDAEVAKEAEMSLGIATELFKAFEVSAKALSSTRVNTDVVVRYVADIFQPESMVDAFGKGFYKLPEITQASLMVGGSSPKVDATQFNRSASDVLTAVNQQPGADLESRRGTLWGAFNAMTYYADHIAGRDRDNALQSAWFGARAAIKTQALKRALQLAQVG